MSPSLHAPFRFPLRYIGNRGTSCPALGTRHSTYSVLGELMNLKLASFLTILAVALTLSSCSGLPVQNCTTNCNQTGNANVTLTIFDAPPTGIDFISFNLPVSAVTLTPQTGANVGLFSASTPAVLEMTHLQSDSFLLGTFQVPAGTYTALNIIISTPFTVFANSSGATVGSCANFSVCNLTG